MILCPAFVYDWGANPFIPLRMENIPMPVTVGPIEAALMAFGPLLCLVAILAIAVVILIVVVRNGNRQKAMQAQMQRTKQEQGKKAP